jgi:hypothetical protein
MLKNYSKISAKPITFHRKHFCKDVCPTLDRSPCLLLILVAKCYYFKMTYAILLVLLLKTSPCLNLLGYAEFTMAWAFSLE